MIQRSFLATSLLATSLLGCSDPVPDPARGAVEIHIKSALSTPTGMGCNVGAHRAQIGAVNEGEIGERAEDGAGADVSCKVTGSGPFSFSGSIKKGSVSFSVQGSAPAVGDSGEAYIVEYDPTSATSLESPQETPCTVALIEAAPGKIWASFDCSAFADTSTNLFCAAQGHFFFERCDQ